jgi:hypothetical protein
MYMLQRLKLEKYQFNKAMQMSIHVRINTNDVIPQNIFSLDPWKALNNYIKEGNTSLQVVLIKEPTN